MNEIELNFYIETQIQNATQPLYDKITELEKALSAISRIALENSENFDNDYYILQDFLNTQKG